MAAAKDTMKQLLVERAKRERELELLRTSEPTITAELADLRAKMGRMRQEMEVFGDLERMRREHEATMAKLGELKQSYIKRRDTMRQQIQGVSVEFESLKKALAANETAKEIEETEKRLKVRLCLFHELCVVLSLLYLWGCAQHFERGIFELREFVESKTRETDYELVKASCLKITNALNQAAIRQAQQVGGTGAGSAYGAQAKGGW